MGTVFNMAGGPPLPLLTSPGAAGDLRAGKQLIDNNGGVLTGTLPEVAQATPVISVSSGGLITATVDQAGGIVPEGSKSATNQLPTQAANAITPSTTAQIAAPAGVYTTGAVTVQGDANLVPENIAEGVSIFGVTGTLAGGGSSIPKFSIKNNTSNLYFSTSDLIEESSTEIAPGDTAELSPGTTVFAIGSSFKMQVGSSTITAAETTPGLMYQVYTPQANATLID